MSEPTILFSDLNLAEPVLEAIKKVGYESPSAIQAATIPELLKGRDVLGQAQTGTGKTAAFALPLLSRLDLSKKPGKPQILVLAPTRELAIQVCEAMAKYASRIPGFAIVPVYGGADYSGQTRQLRRGVHVAVGTPGRVMDHMRRGTLDLSSLQALVLDEADEMLRMGFIDDVDWIMSETPDDRQIALFSATMPKQVHKIATTYLNDPAQIKIETKTTTALTIRQRYWPVRGLSKLDALTRILEFEQFDGMIIFVRTKNATVELAEKCQARGHAAAAINGDMAQKLRERTIEQLKNGKLDILIATDVAARGLDVERISHVLNFDIPADPEVYTHRIGRTGRAGREGDAILFVANREQRMLRLIEKVTRQPIEEYKLPSHEDVNEQRVTRFKARITAELESPDDLGLFRELIEAYQAEHSADPIQLAAALASMAQGDTPLLLKPPKHPARERQQRNERTDRRREDSRPPRKDRADSRPPRRERTASGGKETGFDRYRIEVGREHNVKPGNIVGAIANEAGLDSQNIGRIEIFDNHSVIDLPEGMPKELFNHLKGVFVMQQRLNIAPHTGGDEDRGGDKPFAKKSYGKKAGGKPAGKPTGKPSSKTGKPANKAAPKSAKPATKRKAAGKGAPPAVAKAAKKPHRKGAGKPAES